MFSINIAGLRREYLTTIIVSSETCHFSSNDENVFFFLNKTSLSFLINLDEDRDQGKFMV